MMPSGFQQDQNQLTPSYYRVVIQCGDNNAYWFPIGDSDGPNTEGKISTYSWDSFEDGDLPYTLTIAQALARGNLRFQAIVEAISLLADCQILDIEHAANPNGEDMANNTQIAFTIRFDRDEGVFPGYCAIRKQEEASSSGTAWYDNIEYPAYWSYSGQEYTIANTGDAIRDMIWKSLSQDHSRTVRVFHPVEGSDPLIGEGFQEYITASKPFNNDQNAFYDITVMEIDGTTTTITAD
jgi:hypothetical protein